MTTPAEQTAGKTAVQTAQDPIYLDNAATTRLDDAVLAVMLPYMTSVYGNASSLHGAGRSARRGVERAREQVATSLGVEPRQVVFTSGATEADNLALFGTLASRSGGLITSLVEHPAVLAAARVLAERGRDVEFLAPDTSGRFEIDQLREALDRQVAHGGTALVSLMLVNNETGVVTDTAPFAALAHERGALFMTDAVQGYGTFDVAPAATGADLITLSAHKVNGPKGVGALVAVRGAMPDPILAGGSQERGVRPGTQPVHAIVGFGEAASLAAATREGERERLTRLRERFEARMTALTGVDINGLGAQRSPKHSNLRFSGVEGESLLMALDDAQVHASSGSACAAGSQEPSHVLLAMGLSESQARSSVRFSFGRYTSEAEIDEAAARIAKVVERCRQTAQPVTR